MTNITAKMAHSKESVELMCITQYNTFEFGKKVALYVVAIVGKVSTSISLVCIMIGCFMLTGSNAVAKSRADAVIKQLGGQLPVFNYSFGPTKFSYNPDTEPVSYTSFSRLAEDSNYLYMFLQNRAAFMVQKNTVSGGSDLMRRVTGAGCMLTVLCGAFAAVQPQAPLQAAVQAAEFWKACAAAAESQAHGPASFRVALLDAAAQIV